MGRRTSRPSWWLVGLAVLTSWLMAILLSPSLPAQSAAPAIDFTDVANYPAQQVPDEGYLPVATWSGRLLLPEQAAAAADEMDWVWMEVYTSPNPELIGRRVRLEWQDSPENRAFLDLVTQGIEFDDEAIASIEQGRVHPTRLNGWARVGPLQSLAGTRPQDNMIVALPPAGVEVAADGATLAINAIPIQIPERFYGLVKILGPDEHQSVPAACPGPTPCESDYQRVQHYNPATQTFDGRVETVRVPQVAANPNGIFQSSTQDLANSPAGEAGWYIYGANTIDDGFVVRAIAPRRLFQLQPQQTLVGVNEALNYINFGNWRHTRDRKGTLQSVLVTPTAPPNDAGDWQIGDRMLVVHLFGGVGGEKAEPRSLPGTVTGHFAYGVGDIIADPFTQEPRLRIIYNQVYAHNPQGIVAGRSLWSEYTGNRQRGWLGVRPISDVLVKIPALDHVYQFGSTTLNPFAEFQRELAVMMARYRTGNGSGASIVTPAQSCVQDSSQALYETIRAIRAKVAATPEVTEWLAAHPGDPQTRRFHELIQLGQQMQKILVPLGIARPDWHENADILAGIQSDAVQTEPSSLRQANTVVNNLLSWRTVIPRVAHDNILEILLAQGAEMWFLRTNQVGGADPTMLPLAPSELFGDYVVIPTAFSRLIESLRWPRWQDGLLVGIGLGLFAIARLAIQSTPPDPVQAAATAHGPGRPAIAALVPALVQTVIFRVLLLPHPTEGVQPLTLLIWLGISLITCMAYRYWRRSWIVPSPSRDHPTGAAFSLTLLFGIVASVVYLTTGSLWSTTAFHWGAWLFVHNGWPRLQSSQSPPALR